MDNENALMIWMIYAHLFFLVGPGIAVGLAMMWQQFHHQHIEVAKRPTRKSLLVAYHRKPAMRGF